MIKYAVFDLDGTLLDTLESIAASANAALASMGLPALETAAYRAHIGHGPALARRVLPEGADEKTVAAFLARYRAVYPEIAAAVTRPFPGIDGALAALVRAGVALGVLSNKYHELVRAQVSDSFPGVFADVYGFKEGVPAKPDPAVLLRMAAARGLAASECAYVGDMAVDMRTAENAGFRAVGALWGFGREGLAAFAGRAALAGHPAELARALLGGG